MTNYIAIVPPANLVHSLYDFYVQQQTWVSTQLQNNESPRAHQQPLALTPPPPSASERRRTTTNHRRRRTSKSHINLDLRTRLTYLARQSPVHSRHIRRQRRTRTAKQPRPTRNTNTRRRRTSTSTARTASSPPTTPPLSHSPTPVPPSAGMTLLAMYGDMVKDRMQSCMRLEEMVRDARSRDLFAVPLF